MDPRAVAVPTFSAAFGTSAAGDFRWSLSARSGALAVPCPHYCPNQFKLYDDGSRGVSSVTTACTGAIAFKSAICNALEETLQR